MTKLLFLKCLVFLSCLVYKPNCSYSQGNADSNFVMWNKQTLTSMERQRQVSPDNTSKSKYSNRISAFKSFIDIESINSINRKSIRYNFLDQIFLTGKYQSAEWYIIEANISGDKVLLRNFIVTINPNNVADIEFFVFVGGKWRKHGASKINDFQINRDLKSYLTTFDLGFNHDDIIITRVMGNHISDSEYYLYATLSADSGIKRILDTFKKSNFINTK